MGWEVKKEYADLFGYTGCQDKMCITMNVSSRRSHGLTASVPSAQIVNCQVKYTQHGQAKPSL